MTVWLALGSNLDNPEQQLSKTINYIKEKCYITVMNRSRVVITKPEEYTGQPDFANQILEIETTLSPQELLAFCKATEIALGRQPSVPKGPRLIDIDIMFYNNDVIESETLTIPHPAIVKRFYLLELLNEMIPDYVHPNLGKTVHELYFDFINKGGL